MGYSHGFIIFVTHQPLRFQVLEPHASLSSQMPCCIWNFNHAWEKRSGHIQANETETQDELWVPLHTQLVSSPQGSLTAFAFQTFPVPERIGDSQSKTDRQGAGFLTYKTAVSALCPEYLSMKSSSVIVDLRLDVHEDEGHKQ